MVNDRVKSGVIGDIIALKKLDALPVIVHGGGPVIKEMLKVAKIESKFIEGHRVTDAKAMQYVEMALSGKVNGELVSLINSRDCSAVGLSGKDGKIVTAAKRFHQSEKKDKKIDLGFVGDVESINTELVRSLIQQNYIPVISPVSMDENGDTYNINADMFAGEMAGALKASYYVALTDVDGLLTDKDDASTLLSNITLKEAEQKIGNIIQGGMIPKVESCIAALKKGVKSTHIINGMKAHSLLKELLTEERCGTLIIR